MLKTTKIHCLSKKNKTKLGVTRSGLKVVRGRGLRNKTRFFVCDFKRTWSSQYAVIVSFFKNNKNKIFSLIKYTNGSYSYIPGIHGMAVGNLIKSSNNSLTYVKNMGPGLNIFIKFLKKFFIVSNLQLINNFYKSTYARSAGTYCKLFDKNLITNIVSIYLPTGELKYISGDTRVTLGRNMNILKKKTRLGKAGYSTRFGFKSLTRGVAMNPVDHPNGGRTKTNQPEKSLWGWIAKRSC